MEKIKIIEIKNIIANGGIPPRRIRYDLLEDGYNTLIYDEEELEYRFENDEEQFWEVANHHLNDYVEILEDKKIEKIDMFDYFTGYDFDGTSKDLLKHLERNFEKTNEKLNEIIDYINKENK